MRISSPLVGAGLLATVAGLVACGGSGSQYIQNDDLGVYARIPSDWRVYDEEEIFADASAIEREAQSERMWVRVFDAADEPSLEHTESAVTVDPTGTVQTLILSPSARDRMSLSALRGRGDPAQDPVALASQNPSIGVLANEPVTFDGGFHGVHTVFTAEGDDGTAVFDRTAVLNSTSEVVYLFEVTCTPECYFETHKDEIADVVDSWTIQEVRK